MQLCVSTGVNAEIVNNEEYFTLFCEGEKSTGFNWKRGNWHKASFITEKHIIKKLNPEESSRCTSMDNRSDFKDGCYNIRVLGENFNDSKTEKCIEYWWPGESKVNHLARIICSNSGWKIKPNGWFHKATLNSSLSDSPEGDYKDSLSLTIGKCSTL